MKTFEQIATEIVTIESNTSDFQLWNGKFYTEKDGQTSIYINNQKIDFTENYNQLKDEKGFVYVSRFVELVEKVRLPILEAYYENN
jgi:hypothetical protein